jgi:hypothetical protein
MQPGAMACHSVIVKRKRVRKIALIDRHAPALPQKVRAGELQIDRVLRQGFCFLLSFAIFLCRFRTISGVWIAREYHFPQFAAGECFALKTFGVDALFDGSFPTVMNFLGRPTICGARGAPGRITRNEADCALWRDFAAFDTPREIGRH